MYYTIFPLVFVDDIILYLWLQFNDSKYQVKAWEFFFS